MKYFIPILRHNSKGKNLIFFLGLVFLFFFLYLINNFEIIEKIWTKSCDPSITALTLLATVLVYIGSLRTRWEDSLDKRLTVHFKYKDSYIMTCHQAYLAGEGDMRAWGQQIGSQMNDTNHLSFYPYITNGKKAIEYDPIQKQYFILHSITFHIKDIDKLCPTLRSGYMVWWENDPASPENKCKLFTYHPHQPISLQELMNDTADI